MSPAPNHLRGRPGAHAGSTDGINPSVTVTVFAIVVATCSITGCSDEASGPTYDPDACTTFTVPNQFGYRWADLNHRVSRWEHHLTPPPSETPESASDPTRCAADTLQTAFTGGTFSTGEERSDTPTLSYAYQTVSGVSPRVVGAARRQISTTIEATSGDSSTDVRVDGSKRGSVTFQRDELQLEHYDEIVPIIEGFGFRTDVAQPDSYPDNYDPADGYTSRGVSLSVSVADLTDETVTIDWRIRFGLGASRDREPLNRAIPHARVGADLNMLLIGTSSERLHHGSVSYELSYPQQPPFQEQILSEANLDQTSLQLQGHADHARGIWGLSAVSFELTPDVGCKSGQQTCPIGDECDMSDACRQRYGPAGYYIRELSVDASLSEFDHSAGDARFSINGFASNSSRAVTFYAMNHRFSAQVAWIQTGGSPERTTLERSHPVGATSIPLDQ